MKEMKLRKRNKSKKRRMNPVTGSVEKGVDNEIHIYRSMEEADGEVDILQWWRVNKAKLPIMYRFACKILAIPATSAPSERIFSVATRLFGKLRNNLEPDMVSEVLFVRDAMNLYGDFHAVYRTGIPDN